MRQIKFRAWDKEEKKMIDAETMGNQAWNVLASAMYGKGDWEFMQFTGLLDKNGNGKDIYEGDLMQYDEFSSIMEIYWEPEHAHFKSRDAISKNAGFDIPKHSQIIGNVWENPELINESK